MDVLVLNIQKLVFFEVVMHFKGP